MGRICKHLMQLGFCRNLDACTFAHSYDELHFSSPDLMGAQPDSAIVPGVEGMVSKKTELCSRFAKGYCAAGKSCQFAHGNDELELDEPASKRPRQDGR